MLDKPVRYSSAGTAVESGFCVGSFFSAVAVAVVVMVAFAVPFAEAVKFDASICGCD